MRQGSHAWPDKVGLTGAFADFWKRCIISREGLPHRQLRQIARRALADDFILSLEPEFTRIAEQLLKPLRSASSFDIVARFSEPFAGQVIASLLGEPEEAASGIGRDASTLGLAMGIDARRYEAEVDAAVLRLAARADALLDRAQVSSDGLFVSRLAVAAKEIGFQDRQALIDLIVISVFGGVDTTRAQLGFAAALFAEHPGQWSWLRDNPDAVPQAIEEIIRTRPTTTWATREALEDLEFEGIPIARGETLHILVHASGTDPAIGGVQGFDITTRRKGHFGFGGGAHHCLGQFVARTDMACALRVWLKCWRSLSIIGTPEYLPDSGNTSPLSLRIAPEWQS